MNLTFKRKAPGELELLILKELEKLERASITDICESLGQAYAYTTVLTVLSRMYQKKMVDREKINRQFHYFVKQHNQKNSLLERIKTSLFGGKTSSMIHYLLETSDKISKDELKQIEDLLKKYQK